jgi:membrane AbrB-like protein
MGWRQGAVWTVLITAIVGTATWLDRLRVPAPQLVVAMAVGAALALSGWLPAPLPEQVVTGTHAMLGVLMGSYLQVELLTQVGVALLPVIGVTVLTVPISMATAVLFARRTGADLPTATLGLVAGGSAAVVACADDVEADARTVAFMQYLRVAFVTATAPLVAATLRGRALAAPPHPNGPHWMLVGRGDQAAGLSIAVVLGAAGVRLGRRVGLPNAALVGPMLLSAAVTATGVTHGFAPTNLFKDVLLVVLGFEVGTRFTRAIVVDMMRLAPAATMAIVSLCLLVGLVGLVLALATGLPAGDVYLATTPGGINAVLGIAESASGNAALVTAVQTVRLLLMVLALPLLVRFLRNRVGEADEPLRKRPERPTRRRSGRSPRGRRQRWRRPAGPNELRPD